MVSAVFLIIVIGIIIINFFDWVHIYKCYESKNTSNNNVSFIFKICLKKTDINMIY